jgi:hypothetical protein
MRAALFVANASCGKASAGLDLPDPVIAVAIRADPTKYRLTCEDLSTPRRNTYLIDGTAAECHHPLATRVDMAARPIPGDGGRTIPVIRTEQIGNGCFTRKNAPANFAGAFIEEFRL